MHETEALFLPMADSIGCRARLRPISEKWVPEALAVSGFTREQTMQFEPPLHAMQAFREWLKATAPGGRPLTAQALPSIAGGACLSRARVCQSGLPRCPPGVIGPVASRGRAFFFGPRTPAPRPTDPVGLDVARQ
jgi:hypothetical protein